MTYIYCGCDRRSCGVCEGKKRAFRAGKRAYRKGYSSHRGKSYSYAYDWKEGWLAGRESNPNTARARMKERKAVLFENIVALAEDRKAIDRQLAKLQRQYNQLTK